MIPIRTFNTISVENRVVSANGLTQLLGRLIATSIQAKFAHWNVTGTQFMEVHKLFDDIHEWSDISMDLVGERVLQLGYLAQSDDTFTSQIRYTCQTVEHTIGAVLYFLIPISEVCNRYAIELQDIDPFAADICIKVGQEADKYIWFLSHYLPPTESK